MIQNRSILYEFLRLQKKSHNPSTYTTNVTYRMLWKNEIGISSIRLGNST